MTQAIRIEQSFAAAPATVFDLWVQPEHFAHWFGTAAVDVPLEHLRWEAREGASWSARMLLPDGSTKDWVGEFLAVDAPRHLVFTLTDEPDQPERASVTVAFAPEASGASTLVTMSQEAPGFPREALAALEAGWRAFLAAQADLLAAQR